MSDEEIKNEVEKKDDIKNEDKLFAALSYPIPFFPLFLIFTDKKNVPFCRYHGWQGLFWQITEVFIGVSWCVLVSVLSIFHLGCLLFLISPLIGLSLLVISILFAVKTYSGEYLVIPYLTEFAKKYSENQAS